MHTPLAYDFRLSAWVATAHNIILANEPVPHVPRLFATFECDSAPFCRQEIMDETNKKKISNDEMWWVIRFSVDRICECIAKQMLLSITLLPRQRAGQWVI